MRLKLALPATLAAEERTTVSSWVDQVFGIVRRMPQMAPPAGFQVVPHAFASLENAVRSDGPPAALVAADLGVGLAPYERTSRGAEPNERETAATLAIKVNDLAPLIGSETNLHDAQGAFIVNPPESVGEVHGYRVFEEGNGMRRLRETTNPNWRRPGGCSADRLRVDR